ncbi:MAG: tetratricopeptide repeat protein, partial [Bacteroidales bacterium]
NASQSLPFKERDWIVITDFENQTEESIFDKSLNTAFTLSISQSRYVNVISRKRMLETLKRMKAGEEGFIDEETGREIALREGVNICIVPGISRIGSGYILTAKILDSQSAEILASEVIDAKERDDIIKQLDNMARKIRRNLGESSYMISKQNMPLSKVTTSSLDALKQFSLGLDYHIHMNFDEARIHYENAIEIDSSFTAAKASLGNLLYEKFDRQKGIQLLEEVMESIDDLTMREKYSILSKYAANVENDLDKAIEYSNILLELYPDNSTGYNNLGWYYQLKKEYGKAIEAYKTAIQIDPYTMISYGGLIWIYQEYLAEIDSVKTWSKKLIDTDQENPWGYFYLGSAFAAQDSLEKAEKAFLKARDLDPDFKLNSYRLAHTYSCRKKYDKAIEILKILAESGKDEVAYYYIGINYSLLGEFQKARNNFNFYLESAKEWIELYPNMPQTYIQIGLVLTRLGERESGWETGRKALQIDSTLYFDFARLLAVQNRKTEALDALTKALENGYLDLTWIKINPDLYSLHDEE